MAEGMDKEKEKVHKRLRRIGRDTVIFATGLLGVFHETVINEGERPTLLFLFASMIGLPAFLRNDEKKKE